MKSKELKAELKQAKNNEDYLRERLDRSEKWSKAKSWIICIFLIFVSIVGIGIYLRENIDESSFCKVKITKWFPEYNFKEAIYSDWKCVGYYEETIEKRDGLERVGGEDGRQKQVFRLSEEDINYLQSDDLKGLIALLCLGVIVGIIGGINDGLSKLWRKYTGW